MEIFNVIEFSGEADDHRLPRANQPSTWNGRVFVLVAGATGKDFACYFANAKHGHSPDRIASSGAKMPASKMEDSDLAWHLQNGLIKSMPEDWYWRA